MKDRARLLHVLLNEITDPDALFALAPASEQGAWDALLRLNHQSDALVTMARHHPERIERLRALNMTASVILASDRYDLIRPLQHVIPFLPLTRIPTDILASWTRQIPLWDGTSWRLIAEEMVRRGHGHRISNTLQTITDAMSDDLQDALTRNVILNHTIAFGLEKVRSLAIRRRTFPLFRRLMPTQYSHGEAWSAFLEYVHDMDPTIDGENVVFLIETCFWKAYEDGASLEQSRTCLDRFIRNRNSLACAFLSGETTRDELLYYGRYHAAAKTFGIAITREWPADDPFACLFEKEPQTVLFDPTRDRRARTIAMDACIDKPGVFQRIITDPSLHKFRTRAVSMMPSNRGFEMMTVMAIRNSFNASLVESLMTLDRRRLPLDFLRDRLNSMEEGWGWAANLVVPTTTTASGILSYVNVWNPDAADAMAPLFLTEDDVWEDGIDVATCFTETGWKKLHFNINAASRFDNHPRWWALAYRLPLEMCLELIDIVCERPCSQTVSFLIVKGLATHPRAIRMVRESCLEKFMACAMWRLGVHDRFRAIEASLHEDLKK